MGDLLLGDRLVVDDWGLLLCMCEEKYLEKEVTLKGQREDRRSENGEVGGGGERRNYMIPNVSIFQFNLALKKAGSSEFGLTLNILEMIARRCI